ncbi:MAG: metallophosphoesterase [Clostridiales bacterium]|nr:metallophosphoesterase [Clostridiales bacterium]
MTGRIFITGDKHGTFMPLFGLADKIELKSTDILIIAGDAGYVWKADYISTVENLRQVFPGTVAFIDGNHENHDVLNSLDTVSWMGGKAHYVADRVYHMLRGEIYSIYGNNIFTFGGARSVDKDRREEGVSWWKDEEPNIWEMEYGREKLAANIDNIDYVITHETPLFARAFISRTKVVDSDYQLPAELDKWYGMIADSPRLKKWYFGHMHVDQLINEKLRAIHNDIVLLGDENIIRWA